VPNLTNNSLINCAGTNSSNFTIILSFIARNRIHFTTRKKRVFPGSFSQLPETRILKLCPELETLVDSSETALAAACLLLTCLPQRDLAASSAIKSIVRCEFTSNKVSTTSFTPDFKRLVQNWKH